MSTISDCGEYISRDCYHCGKQIRKDDEVVRGIGFFHWREWHFECYAEAVAEEDEAERHADDGQFGAGA